MATNIEQSICDAIDIIVNRAVATASYDKTVQATIVSCVDATIGKFKVRYQDSTFYAYSGSSEVTYSNGASVYVLIPGNDMSQDKTILGAVKKLGIDYVTVAEGEEAYEVNGTNICTSTGSFDFSSYKEGTQVIVLYSKDYADEENLISIDTLAMNEYFKDSSSIICGGVFRTSLPIEQQYRGDYGLIFALDFLDNTGNQVVTRYYTVDVDNMTGNPYKLITNTRQTGIFDIDSENFIEINYISAFCYDFPNTLPDEECIDDIFISDIEISGANRLSDEELENYTLTFVTPQGTYFTASSLDSDTLEIQGQVRVKGKVIDNESQSLPFYWGIEHVGITSQSEYYCKYLGQGWKCLNDYNIIEQADEADPMVVEWVPSNYKFTVAKTDIIAKEVTYKCAVIYDNTVITKTFTIKNLASGYDITIESDSGTQFYFDIGYPTLKCLISGEEYLEDNYVYSWAVTNNAGNFSTIAETPELNDDYNALYEEYTQLLEDIAAERKQVEATAELRAALEKSLAEYETIMRVERNSIYHLNVNTITSFSTYQCTVYYGNYYIGTASITLLNTLAIEGVYSLVINDGCYAYKYNESGISPASEAVDSPIAIKALTFTMYDNLGQPIDDAIAQHCDIRWTVPTKNTLLEIPDSYEPDEEDEEAGTATYYGLMSLAYGIASRYDITKQNNDIYLTIVYKDVSLSAKTDLTFTKEGESGTNGTEYSIKIVPNNATGTTPKYWIITQSSNGTITHNFTPVNTGQYLKVQMFHNENKVLDTVASATTDEGKSATITWEILRNQYTGSYQDTTALSVTSAGVFSYSGFSTDHPAHIVKVTLVCDGVTYYATYPVITVRISNDNYNIALKEGTGFQYATYTSDGRSPKYDNTNPFEVIVTRLIDGYWEDVSRMSTSDYVMTYSWTYLGRTYGSGSWIVQSDLMDRAVSGLDECQHAVKPADSYDGQCVTNAVQCTTFRDGTEVARIHIPVHLMINKYGLAALNGWDGNSIQIDADSGFILTPQAGAGVKNSDNTFTGVLMGAVKESGSATTEIGLFGYYQGQRSIFLDSTDGSATFGINHDSQIRIDPSNHTAIIESGDYNSGTGLRICFSSTYDNEIGEMGPYIKYGSGNFSVDANGYITAKGGGSIAGFCIDDDSLWTGTSTSKSDSSNFRISSEGFTRTVNGDSRSDLRLASSTNFAVDGSGYMYAAHGLIGSGSVANKIYIGNSSSDSSASALYTVNKDHFVAASRSGVDNGFYLGTDGFAFGKEFSISSNGAVRILGGTIDIQSRDGDDLFYVDEDGVQLGDFYISADESYFLTFINHSDEFYISRLGSQGPNGTDNYPKFYIANLSQSSQNTTTIIGGSVESYRFYVYQELYLRSFNGHSMNLTEELSWLESHVGDNDDDEP